MIPSRLVVVRRYSVASAHGYFADVGEGDRKLLAGTGIESFVKLDRLGSVVLVVPESQAADARRALADSPDLFQQQLAPPCPRCHTLHPEARPPYELAPIGLGILVAGALSIAGLLGIAYAVVSAAVVAAAIMHSRMPPFRCHACGFRFALPHDH